MDAKILRWARVIQPLIPVQDHLRGIEIASTGISNSYGDGDDYGNGDGASRAQGLLHEQGMGYGDGFWTGDGNGGGKSNVRPSGNGHVYHS